MFSFKSIKLLFAQFRVPSLTIWLKQQHFLLIVIIVYTFFAYPIAINQYIFITGIFKPQLFSSHTMCLYTRLTEFFLNPRWLLSCILYGMVNSLINAFECLWFRETSIYVNKLLAVLLLPVYMFNRFFVLHFVVVCLLLNTLFWYLCCCYFLFIR